MAPLLIPELVLGSRVQNELLVLDRADKKTNAGDPFVVLTLGNRSGKVDTAPIWSDKLGWADGANQGRVVQAIGQVQIYPKTGKRQLELTAPLRAMPAERFSVGEFLPHCDEPPEALWPRLDKARNRVGSPALRAVLACIFGDDDFRVRFEQAPGSTRGHHAKVGGLLQHTIEVVNIAVTAANSVRRANPDLVIAGALLHDIGKVESYDLGPAGFSATPCGLLVGHVVLGVLQLERQLATLGDAPCSDGQLLELRHMILSHHGKREYGSPVEPMTVEAEIVHRADEASAKATDFLDAFDDADLWTDGGEFSKKTWTLSRQVWKRPHGWD